MFDLSNIQQKYFYVLTCVHMSNNKRNVEKLTLLVSTASTPSKCSGCSALIFDNLNHKRTENPQNDFKAT